MNSLHTYTAKICRSTLVVCFVFCLSNHLYAQKEYTTISKNINPEARSLYHDLSPQGDSLYLKSESIFYKVTFLNSLDRKVYKFNPPVLEGKIPLYDIIVGDYTVLVYKKDRIIVFHISRLLEIDKPSELIVSKDIAVKDDLPLDEIIISKTTPREVPASEIIMNEINKDKNFEFDTDDIKLAINDTELNAGQPIFSSEPRGYNLSDLNRDGVQSREEYRRNNLRPNGKPYH